MTEVDLNVLQSEETRESAEEFINRLGDNGLENMKKEMRQMFKASLKADYDELYGKPEHFLQELLQNADDVEYKDPDSEPKFSITTQDPFDTVRFDSNETGFTRKDVHAVCRSRMGTKAGQTATTGEKGIGFKSVFAIAETASIASGPYRFKLDRSQEFGTICPKVWDVPSNITVEKTGSTLVLEIDKTGKFRDEVCEIIRHFDPDTILFLRKLKLVEIKTYQYVGPDIFRREEFRAEDGTTHVIIRENGICKSWFKIFESPVRNLTPRPRYPSVQDSIIKLAFPVDAKFEHAKEFPNAQQVYTFLPIANYGPGFTIQGEFVLTSSREDIQPRVAWNDELLEAIPRIFSDAIKVLNQSNLRFSWPIFLSIYEPRGFFKDIREKIVTKLDGEEIMQVEDETKPLAKPSTVVIVPDELKLRGVPLIRSKAALSRYLSHRYSPDCITYLKLAMKMKELSTDGFLEDLKEYVECVDDESVSSGTLSGDEGYVPFRAQSTEWHSCIASILMKYTWQSIVQQMKMIPLSDGKTWTAATPENKGNMFFLSQENQKQDILDGINVRFVHPDIMRPEENQRFQLFQALGVDKFEASKLCKRIEAAHGNASGTFTSTLGEQSLVKALISHDLFLFRNGHNPSVDLWVATEAGKESRASATYFRDIERRVAGWQCPVLHQDYYTCAKDEEKDRWMKWLDMELHIRKYPRLVDSFPRPESFLPSDFNIAEEMELILNDRTNWTPYGILKLLQRHWDTGHWAKYSQWLKEGDAKWSSTSVSKLRERISELQVTCLGPQGRVVHCLKGTILPSAGLEGAYEGAPLFILDVYGDGVDNVERVEGRDWYFLQHLGVKLNPDLDDCISCLRTLRDKADSRKREALSYIRIIYDRISQICHESPENNEKVKSAFNSDGLTYIPQYSSSYRIPWPVNSSWVSARNCVWKGAKYASRLKNHSVLSHHYARHARLFLDIVRVQFTVEISDILSEIESNAVLYGSIELYGILRELSEFIRENPDASSYKSKQSGSSFRSVLSRHRIFPISQPGSTSIINDTCAATSQWFIPDHQAFYSLFSEKIPLMVIDPEKLIDISHLLQYLGCNQRRLSSQARAYPTNPDKVRYARNYSARLQEKAKYIQS
ncbi:hypothetical protein F4821DRAFT_121086 [Hypoxylon rubiginosum]|uniref:Uncharacterized protein n=1 Tax=Hypoxylon rubiginosum TaxID=110542 RepID=A0ACC0D2M0_9PEZI|nr:hypothetical protein F4821DRAFT_121086 [Hypoxylon rubiginosum]